MNKQQYNKARKLLAKDCKIDCRYLVGEKTCAIGCLALAAGVSRRTLEMAKGSSISSLPYIARKVQKAFGLSLQSLSLIQSANDYHDFASDRRQEVLETLKQFKP